MVLYCRAHSSPHSPKASTPKSAATGGNDAESVPPPKPQSNFNVDAIFEKVMSNAAQTLLKYDERLANLELEKQLTLANVNGDDDQEDEQFGVKSHGGVENPAQSETPAMLMADSEVSNPHSSRLGPFISFPLWGLRHSRILYICLGFRSTNIVARGFLLSVLLQERCLMRGCCWSRYLLLIFTVVL